MGGLCAHLKSPPLHFISSKIFFVDRFLWYLLLSAARAVIWARCCFIFLLCPIIRRRFLVFNRCARWWLVARATWQSVAGLPHQQLVHTRLAGRQREIVRSTETYDNRPSISVRIYIVLTLRHVAKLCRLVETICNNQCMDPCLLL